MWKELVGSWTYAAGTTGTVTLPEGAIVLKIHCESNDAAGAVTIFGGDSILVSGGAAAGQHQTFDREFNHSLCQVPSTNKTIVFTNMASYYVEYLKAAGT